MNITYDYYRIFYFVAKYQSFTKAANILLSNEPNISRSIRNLEHEFGVSLFIRSKPRCDPDTGRSKAVYPRRSCPSSAQLRRSRAGRCQKPYERHNHPRRQRSRPADPAAAEASGISPEISGDQDPHFQRDNASGRLFLKKRTRRPRDRHQPDRRHTPLKGDSASSDPGGSHRRSTLCLTLRHTQNS